MCSNFKQQQQMQMDNYGGDLADIIRTGGTINASTIDNSPAEISGITHHDYDQFHNNRQIDQYRLGLMDEDPLDDEFGDPFSLLLQDPLIIHDDDSSNFFNNNVDTCSSSINIDNQSRLFDPKIADQEDHDLRRPSTTNTFFTKIFDHVSPKTTKLSVTTPLRDSVAVNDVVISNSKGENGGVQISSPRNAGIKRRKSQAKKVVCIPAPAPVNSRPSGEVVPSDLWAWRKYGQKPIKGSPYPRGYYRCSSCKGCPARKQVERSRNDPNMLVITYTCEHNHPWPTQRNALAGSTRTTHPASRSGSGSNSKTTHPTNNSSSNISQSSHKPLNHDKSLPLISSVKEEMKIDIDHHADQFSHHQQQVFQQSAYKPGFPDESSHSEDFFAELGELEADPMNILFPNGYSEVDDCENKSLDPFTFYDWAGNKNNNNLLRPEDNKGS